ncbi:transcriptional repressor LexA [Phascolarctobacterium faecium]|jgi:repressor LexA|uniref:transcriptional repressor LexA n=1 Tax=Phascolarctobacterium faecium TaxID=33025 RepID=UPI00351F847A
MDTIGKRMRLARINKQKTLEDIAKAVGVSRQTIQRYESGVIGNIPYDKIEGIAKALNVTPGYLMGWEQLPDIPDFPNIFPIETKKIPLLGKIAAGQPVMAEECFDSYVQCGTDIHADFCLRVQGDSMINARIYDGDIVFIHKQPEVENGEIAAVAIDDEVTLKRVYMSDNFVELRAENPKYKPMVFNQSNCLNFRILGKAIAFQGDIV